MGRIIFVVQLLMLWASGQPLLAQDSLFIKPRQSSKVSVQKDNRIDLLIKKQIQVNTVDN